MEFSTWITKKYLEWRSDKIGNAGSIVEFARRFGASQQLMSEWMKPHGKKPRSHKYINALVAEYGNEVYVVLGLEISPNPLPIEKVPPALRERLEGAMREIANTLEKQNLDPESEAAQHVAREVMAEYGFRYSATE